MKIQALLVVVFSAFTLSGFNYSSPSSVGIYKQSKNLNLHTLELRIDKTYTEKFIKEAGGIGEPYEMDEGTWTLGGSMLILFSSKKTGKKKTKIFKIKENVLILMKEKSGGYMVKDRKEKLKKVN
jgi:hypothetical protein